MIGTGGWDIFVTGVNGFVGKDGTTKGNRLKILNANFWSIIIIIMNKS